MLVLNVILTSLTEYKNHRDVFRLLVRSVNVMQVVVFL